MSKRHRKFKSLNADAVETQPLHADYDPALMEAPRGKRPKGKAWGKHKRANQKSAYYD